MRNVYRFSFLTFFLTILWTTTIAQQFQQLNGPYGGGTKVYEGRSGILYQFMDSGEFYRSLDGGGS
ncbi:MAG TPA: hypothetical protein VFX48_01920, partial [Saprospiraceae bacterium]|nr:hypothetical protein [Saprospiraceae bacterium]